MQMPLFWQPAWLWTALRWRDDTLSLVARRRSLSSKGTVEHLQGPEVVARAMFLVVGSCCCKQPH